MSRAENTANGDQNILLPTLQHAGHGEEEDKEEKAEKENTKQTERAKAYTLIL